MRLIDADSLLKVLNDNLPHELKDLFDDGVYNGLMVAIDCLLDETTINAITIEWIEKKALQFLMNKNIRWATDFQEVVDMWKVENNIPLFDDELKITLEKRNEKDI